MRFIKLTSDETGAAVYLDADRIIYIGECLPDDSEVLNGNKEGSAHVKYDGGPRPEDDNVIFVEETPTEIVCMLDPSFLPKQTTP